MRKDSDRAVRAQRECSGSVVRERSRAKEERAGQERKHTVREYIHYPLTNRNVQLHIIC